MKNPKRFDPSALQVEIKSLLKDIRKQKITMTVANKIRLLRRDLENQKAIFMKLDLSIEGKKTYQKQMASMTSDLNEIKNVAIQNTELKVMKDFISKNFPNK